MDKNGYTVILLEGNNDKLFIKWLLDIYHIQLPNYVKIAQVGGKSKFRTYIEDDIKAQSYDKENMIDYEKIIVSKIVIIKDFDTDDKKTEEKELQKIAGPEIFLEVKYIDGTDNPPRTLETLIINNDGDRLKHYRDHIHEFDKFWSGKTPKQSLGKITDKTIFESYLKLTVDRIEYSEANLNQLFDKDKIKQTPQLVELVEYIQSL